MQSLQWTGQGRCGHSPAWASSYVSTELCALLVGDVGGQGVYDVKQQLLAQRAQRGQLGDLWEATKG